MKTVNVGGKDIDLSKVGPGMRQKLLQKNVGTNASKEVQKINPKVGQTVTTKQDPKTGSVSSTVTSKKTIGVDTSPGKSDTKSLVNNNKKKNIKDAQKAVQQQNQKNKEVADMTGEPAGKVTTGKIDFGGF